MAAEHIDWPWHASQWRQLQTAWRRGQLHHALLLMGPAGLGKREFARRVAGLVLCSSTDEESEACGHCRDCRLLTAENHPDLHIVAPLEKKRTIGIEQTRDLCNALTMKALVGQFKVALIHPAEALTLNAANSLLKTLEEPVADTLLMLCCTRTSALPPTIVSRCQKIRFATPVTEEALGWLDRRGTGVEWGRLLHLAGGAPRRALELVEQELPALEGQLRAELLAINDGRQDPAKLASSWSGSDMAVRLDWLYVEVCDLVRSVLGVATLGSDADPSGGLHSQLPALRLEQLFAYLDRLLETRALLDTSMNRQLAMEALLIPWSEGLRKVDTSNT